MLSAICRNGRIGEPRGLVKIGSDDRRARKQRCAHGGNDTVSAEVRPACRDKHGIEDQRDWFVALQRRGNGGDNFRRSQHPDLNGRHLDVGKNHFDLPAHEFSRGQMDAADALGVLRGQGARYRHAVTAECREGLEIGLDSGAAARVGSRDGQKVWDRRFQQPWFQQL